MKTSIGVAVIVFFVALGIWLSDIAEDRSMSVKVTESVVAYDNWECGNHYQLDCKIVFETVVGQSYSVQRIRYGKDFMAIKVTQTGVSGWIYAGKGVHVIAEPNT